MFKMETKLTSNGREISWDEFGDELTKLAIENIKEQLRERLEPIVCPDHGQHVSLTLVGSSTEKLNYEIGGCCQKAIDLARAAVS